MCDPIIDDSEVIETEPFTKEVVDEYLRKRSVFNKYPLRHYSQLEVLFERSDVKRLLKSLGIPTLNIRVTVFGGYTGHFAKCLRDIGMKVIFTDPLEEWVRNAIDSGFEAYKYSAAQIPREIIERTDLFATFECYHALQGDSAIYNILRFLTTNYGILFGESKYTRDEIDKEIGKKTARLIYDFLPYHKVYSIKRTYRERGSLRLYHFSADENKREIIKLDVKIMKLLYDTFPNKICLTLRDIYSLAYRVSLRPEVILCSLKRTINLYQLRIHFHLRPYFPPNLFKICSKIFTFDDSVESALKRTCISDETIDI